MGLSPRQEQISPSAARAFFNMMTSFKNNLLESVIMDIIAEEAESEFASVFSITNIAGQLGVERYTIVNQTQQHILDDILIPTSLSQTIKKALAQNKGVSFIAKPIVVNNQAYYLMVVTDGDLGSSYLLISHNRFMHDVDIVESVVNAIGDIIAAIKASPLRGLIKDFGDIILGFLKDFEILQTLSRGPPLSDSVKNGIKVFNGRLNKFISKLGILNKIFDFYDVVNYLLNCFDDVGSATCIGAYAVLKFADKLFEALAAGAAVGTLGTSYAVKKIIEIIIKQAVEAAMAYACNPAFQASGREQIYYYTEEYGGDAGYCYKEVEFGTQRNVIENNGLFPMVNIMYKIESDSSEPGLPGSSKHEWKIPFLPGDNFGLAPVDWLDGSNYEYLNHGKVHAADEEDYADVVEIREDRVFQLSAEDEGKCKIDYKILGIVSTSLGRNAKVPYEEWYQGNIKEVTFNKAACCNDRAKPSEFERCLNTIIPESSNDEGYKRDTFTVKDDVYVNIEYDTVNETVGKIYIVDKTLFDELNSTHSSLEDASDESELIEAPIGRDEFTKTIWEADDDNPLGDYEIIFDRNLNGLWDPNVDDRDLNGFSLIKEVIEPDMYIDSKGTMHMVAIEKSSDGDYLMYANFSNATSYKIELENEELFDWSKMLQNSLTREIRRSTKYSHLKNPKVAVDSKGNVHIVTMFDHNSGYKWLLYDNISAETGQIGVDTLMVQRDHDGWSFDMMNPSITIDPNTDVPVIAVNMEVMFPEPWWIQNVYLPMYISTFTMWFTRGLLIASTGSLMGVLFGIQLAVCSITDCNFDPIMFLYTHFSDYIITIRKVDSSDSDFIDFRKGWAFKSIDQNTTIPFRQKTSMSHIGEFEYPLVAIDNETMHVVYIWDSMDNDPRMIYKKCPLDEDYCEERIVISDDSKPNKMRKPDMDLGPDNNIHVIWLDNSSNLIYRDTEEEEIVELLENLGSNSRPQIAVDGADNVYVTYLGTDENYSQDVFYIWRNSTSNSTEWQDPVRLTNALEYTDNPWINYPLIDTNKRVEDDWTNRVWISWMDSKDHEKRIMHRKTLPHTTLLVTLDGVSAKALDEHLGDMPNLKSMIGGTKKFMKTDATTTFPETTFSTQASLITGVIPSKHKVIGDNWEGNTYFPPANPVNYNDYEEADKVNVYLENEDVKTLFDHFEKAGYKTAAAATIFNKGVSFNNKVPIEVKWESGEYNFNKALEYLEKIDGTDDDDTNDPPDFISLYILNHDHGVDTEVDEIDYEGIDDEIGKILDILAEKRMLNDTIFIFTSDHEMTDVNIDDINALIYSDLWADALEINPMNLYLNSKVAYYYVEGPFNSTVLPAARYFDNKSFMDKDSEMYGALESIYVKAGGSYFRYEYNPFEKEDIIHPTPNPRIDNLANDKTPEIIMIARTTTYECSSCLECNNYIDSAMAGDDIKLTADITDHAGSCIDIQKPDIIFNCQGHKIHGVGGGITYGINVNGDSVSVENCFVENFYYGISLSRSSSPIIRNSYGCNNLRNDFNVYASPNYQGYNNTCDKSDGFNDVGLDGCTLSCTGEGGDGDDTNESEDPGEPQEPEEPPPDPDEPPDIEEEDVPDKNYFQEPHRALFGVGDEEVPFIICGEGYNLFSPGNDKVKTVDIVDIGVTAGYFIGGQKLVDSLSMLDGRNKFEPQLEIKAHSPVDLHLYDSMGRHTGPNVYGFIETNIPSSSYIVDNVNDDKTITLLDTEGEYKLVLNAYEDGEFYIEIDSKVPDKTYYQRFPVIDVINHSIGLIESLGDDLKFDLEFDGTFESIYQPDSTILIEEGENNANVTFNVVSGEYVIDLKQSVGLDILTNVLSDISNGQLVVTRVFNNSYDSPGFYTLGEYIDMQQTGLSSLQNNITMYYPFKGQGAPNYISLYKFDGSWTNTSYESDWTTNSFSDITEFGTYMAVATEMNPIFTYINVTVNANIDVKVNVTDDGILQNVSVELQNQIYELTYNPSNKLYEQTLGLPAQDGTYYLVFKAIDDKNNTNFAYRTIKVDTTDPNVTIYQPDDGSVITDNPITVKYSTGERTALDYYKLDGVQTTINRSGSFILNSPHGNHQLTVYAEDRYGNTGQDTINFEMPEHNIEISSLYMPAYAFNESIDVIFNVRNTGNYTENVTIQLLENGTVYSSMTLVLNKSQEERVLFNWQGSYGYYNLTVQSLPVAGETYNVDNIVESMIKVSDKIVVLLVDDSENLDSDIYKEAIIDSGFDFILVDSADVEKYYLDKFGGVIWFTGNGSLDFNERANLRYFLNRGGFLFLSGNNLGKTIGSTVFYEDYLYSSYLGENNINTIEGLIDDPISNGLLFSINTTGEMIYPNSIFSSESMVYSGGKPAGIKVEYGRGGLNKVVYLGFNLHEIDTLSRKSIIENSLYWFDIDVIPPSMNISIINGTGLPINTINLTIEIGTDEKAWCRISDEQYRYGLMDRFDNTASTNHIELLNNLTDGTSYHYNFVCKDIWGNSNLEQVDFFIWNRTFFAPEFSVSNQTVSENETIQIMVNATDPEGDNLTYQLSDVLKINFPKPFAHKFTFINDTFEYDIGFNDSGNYKLLITVSDGYSNTSKEIILNILDVNRPPQLAMIGNLSIDEDVYFSYDVNATDADGDSIIFSDDTVLFDIDPLTGLISFTPKNSDIGSYLINISATDNKDIVSELINLNIGNINDAPVIDFITPQYATQNVTFFMNIIAYDPDGDNLTFFDNTTMFDIINSAINFTPSNLDVGTHFIVIGVSDGQFNRTKILNLIIEDVNQAPIIIGIPDIIFINPGDDFAINVTACDPDFDLNCTQ